MTAVEIARAVRAGAYDIVHGFGRTYAQDVVRVGGGCHLEYLARTHPLFGSAWGRTLLLAAPKTRAILDIERRTYARGAYRRITCISRQCLTEIRHHYDVPEADAEVIYNGVDLEAFHPRTAGIRREPVRAEMGVPSEALVALFVGSGFSRKNLGTALDGVAPVARAGNAHLLVLGADPTGRFQEQAERLGIGPRVRFLGHRDNVADYYAASDVLVFPTRYEPFGTVALEALASGLPVVAPRSAGCAEILTEGSDAFLLPEPGDSAGITRALETLSGPARRRTMGAAARATAEKYSWDENFRRTMAVYDRVLALKKT